ncbi:hypothetical protein ACFW8Z_17145, partial [Streptomyces sp. NPDC059515]
MSARPSPASTLDEAAPQQRSGPLSRPVVPPALDDAEDLALDPVEQAVADIAAGRPVVGGGGGGRRRRTGAGRDWRAAAPPTHVPGSV